MNSSSQIGSQEPNSQSKKLSNMLIAPKNINQSKSTNKFNLFQSKQYAPVAPVAQKRDLPPPVAPAPKKVVVPIESDSSKPVPRFVAPVEPVVSEILSADSSDEDSDENEFNVDNQIYCMFEQVKRSKNKWKFIFKNGVMHVNGKDNLLFQKATGDAEW
jgi:hypothetical protein